MAFVKMRKQVIMPKPTTPKMKQYMYSIKKRTKKVVSEVKTSKLFNFIQKGG